ncbi:MAG: cell division ATPase MinD, partial [Nanoarchaeota archaeon]|nr:cell division ATPase MinD [Nanoarchaeota archaeon]MBU4242549.1 cell division ATPase MinD [Nanoarchaeota archaeon]MBU4352642.1 cell division ATPase MinD [Nanoarchaeota archaeon]MBU4456085.1 cell division ATPase MinD [Nanoarchaeota archaeon]MCG2719925.1 cell division ATPase MinD [Nanoarchaeota archaeon]
MTKFIAIMAGKGGTGKTTTSVNLGAALSYFGKDVIVVDANLTTPNVGLHLGVPVVPIHLHHVLQGKNEIHEAVYIHPAGLKIVPGSIALSDLHITNPEKLSSSLKKLRKLKPDFVLVDGAAGLGREALNAISAVDDLLIVTNAELPAITDAMKTIKLAEDYKKNVIGVVLTKTGQSNSEITIRSVESMLERPVISVIPYDVSIKHALKMKDAVVFTHPRSKPAVSYKKLAAALIGQDYVEDYSVKVEKKGFLVSLFKKFFK